MAPLAQDKALAKIIDVQWNTPILGVGTNLAGLRNSSGTRPNEEKQ